VAILCLCDLCKSLIKQGDNKFLFGYSVVKEQEDEETRKQHFAEVLDALYKGKHRIDGEIKIVEICSKCVTVFASMMKMRQEDLKKVHEEISKILVKKMKTEKKEKNNG
jgi:hypothetical protein